ncbi:MAG: sugar transferase [Candidatus Sphingomonas colombiensis]|nr:sugar transferase [Sphingomonas sp.]WEK44391.1 MAG: sugar transferase [Sphingomonas sp.]
MAAGSRAYRFAKRGLDLTLAGGGLAVLAVPLVLVALLVRWKLGAPVLFRQERAGRNGRPFQILKFRSMTDQLGVDGALLSDAQRLTPFGAWLRSTSIDELPSLLNILRGDLSIVGPRPLFMRYIPRYTLEQARRLEVSPGLTGWAQARGRNSLSWNEKFRLDVWYVDHRSFMLDLGIIAATALQVLRREGISALGDATMPEFMGNDQV